jgi:hypothetical protein
VEGLARILRGGGVGESQIRFSRNTLCELSHIIVSALVVDFPDNL